MSFKIVNTLNIPGKSQGEEKLKSADIEYIKGMWNTEEELIANCAGADAVMGDLIRKPFVRKVIESFSPNCRILAGIGLGFDKVDLEAATEKGIVVTNVPDYCLDEVSGRAIALMLALAYKIIPLNEGVKAGKLADANSPNPVQKIMGPVYRTRGLTLGLIGCSKIGTATALKARGLGMRVIAYDPYLFDGALESLGIEPVDMETLLKESDFVSMHVPSNAETKGLLGYEQLKKMKKTAFVINTARGAVIDEPALVKALQEGLIAGAGLDVTVKEPVDTTNPLTQMPNVILTGHSAWFSLDADGELFFKKPISQVLLALKGQWPPYAINPQVRKKWLEKWAKK